MNWINFSLKEEIPYLNKNLSKKTKKYNNQKLIYFSEELMNSLLIKPKNRSKTIQVLVKINKDRNPKKVSKCMELVQKFCPERRKLKIREALLKKNPLFDKESTSKGYLLCSECDIKNFYLSWNP